MPEVPSLLSSQEPTPPPPRDDIGYVLGWFCGGILALGVMVAVVFLAQGSLRKAFQAVALPVAVVLWITLMMEGLVVHSDHGISEDIGIIGVLVGVTLLPILGVYVLRKVPWPPVKKPAK